jgi:ferritin
MLTSQKVIDAINEQIGYEFSAELQYYAIAAHFAARPAAILSASSETHARGSHAS